MGQYAIRRLLAMIPTVFLLSILVFYAMRVMPGDVALLMLAGPNSDHRLSPRSSSKPCADLGLNDPLPVQYMNWVGDLVLHRGGDSLINDKPVYDEILRRLPLTAQLTVTSILVAHLIAIPAGVISALRRNTGSDYFVRIFAMLGLAIPNFWFGIMVILILLNVFNYAIPLGYVSPLEDPFKNFQQQIFPTLILGTALSASITRMTRATVLEVMREDYVRTARAKGLKQSQIVIRHALRNSMLPVMTLSALQLGFLISGSVIIERVFSLPGLGRYLVDAIFQRDYIVVQTIVLLFGIVIMMINLLTDLAYGLVDPRIRYR